MSKYAYDLKRPSARKRGYTKAWERASKAFLKRNPLCKRCKSEGRLVEAKLVDHIIPHEGKPSLFWNKKNWQSLCHSCHSIKTMEDRTGKPIIKGGDVRGMPTNPDHHWKAVYS